ncbi:hypothetical protein PQ469_24650 [Mucilaginibacter sp. KACC 22773]|uniref:hypothetical protein n=1 Tax=Mucilaginibacter sp. KACC 22773 TaxID=3025671 RepID=UPI002366ADAA|nr:hypothetical protein [Mucilaginibacter sp. KACC 22773]WDF77078.1 hypothetical protein PQ469_24650 [Mucilaginibacter sp. KACC 22773]
MCDKVSQEYHPDFSTLSGIMEHFSRVPLEQFKADLNEWFYKSLDDNQIDLCKLNGENTIGFPEQLKHFVQDIYNQAEVLRKKQDDK